VLFQHGLSVWGKWGIDGICFFIMHKIHEQEEQRRLANLAVIFILFWTNYIVLNKIFLHKLPWNVVLYLFQSVKQRFTWEYTILSLFVDPYVVLAWNNPYKFPNELLKSSQTSDMFYF